MAVHRRILPRTYSSPSLKDATFAGYGSEDDEFFIIGDRVLVDGRKTGSVAYFGEVESNSGDWVGVVLDEPSGNHSGKMHGREYFQCPPLHGLFVRPHRVRRILDSALGSSADSSRVASPTKTSGGRGEGATSGANWRAASRSPGASTLDSGYYYDDDYRRPTAASLERKLASLESRAAAADRRNNAPTGILKTSGRRPSQGGGGGSPAAARIQELVMSAARQRDRDREQEQQRLRDRQSVFDFRPRREPLDSYNLEPATDPGRLARPATVDLRSSEPARPGDRVEVRTDHGTLTGILRYRGETEFATGEWAGVELDTLEGKHDGSLMGVRYFRCLPNRGLFVPAVKIRKCRPGAGRYSNADSTPVSSPSSSSSILNTIRSTIKSPPPRPGSRASPSADHTGHRDGQSASPSPLLGSTSYDFASSFNEDTSGPLSPRSAYATAFDWDMKQSCSPPDESHHRHQNPVSGREKFDFRDLERELFRSLDRPPASRALGRSPSRVPTTVYKSQPQAHSVTYTFTSSKLDGNPIAKRTLIYY